MNNPATQQFVMDLVEFLLYFWGYTLLTAWVLFTIAVVLWLVLAVFTGCAWVVASVISWLLRGPPSASPDEASEDVARCCVCGEPVLGTCNVCYDHAVCGPDGQPTNPAPASISSSNFIENFRFFARRSGSGGARVNPLHVFNAARRWVFEDVEKEVNVTTFAGEHVCFIGEYSLCSDEERDDMKTIAQHIVDLHNAWIDSHETN